MPHAALCGRGTCPLVREEGVEPSWPFDRWHLKPVRIPFRHSRPRHRLPARAFALVTPDRPAAANRDVLAFTSAHDTPFGRFHLCHQGIFSTRIVAGPAGVSRSVGIAPISSAVT